MASSGARRRTRRLARLHRQRALLKMQVEAPKCAHGRIDLGPNV